MQLRINTEPSENDQPYEDAVSLMFKEALVKLFNSFIFARDYHGVNSASVDDLLDVASLAENARDAKAELDQLVADYSIDYDPKRIKIVSMHDYVCLVESNLWGERHVA